MGHAADLIVTNAEIHSLGSPDETFEAVAIRDGTIVRIGRAYEVKFLEGVQTLMIDLDGQIVIPGFIDAHTHLEMVGRHLLYVDLSHACSIDECVKLLVKSNEDGQRFETTDAEWILGFGYDESSWRGEQRYLTREELDRVSVSHPVAAVRVDMHVVSLNSVALDLYGSKMPRSDVRESKGRPTGVVVEDAAKVIYDAVKPGPDEMRALVLAAQSRANELGITAIHDMVRSSNAPRVYRDLESEGKLTLRIRLNYWSDHLDSVMELGLRTNHGSDFVRMGGIKSFIDGSIGGRTAKLSEPYSDIGGTGQWIVPPHTLHELVDQVDRADIQLILHAIGDLAIDTALTLLEETENPAESRHRIEHLELATDEAIERVRDTGTVASVQPNFLKWAQTDGLYEWRLGSRRRNESNRFGSLHEGGAMLAFGSDCMPLDPLFGIHQVVNAPRDEQRLPVTDAIRAYTYGAAYAGFDEQRLGTIEVGKKADLVVLEASPWERPESIDEIDVAMTFVDGNIVHDVR